MLHSLRLTEKWESGIGKPMSYLEKEMYVSIRNPDEPISDLIAQRILNSCVPINTLDIVLGVISDQSIDTALELGGAIVACEKIKADPMVPAKIFHKDGSCWPIPVAEYHEIRLVNIPYNANVWALGVRVNKEIKKCLEQPLRIPDTLWISQGCYRARRPFDDSEGIYTDLPGF